MQIGSNQHHALSQQLFTGGNLINVTGELFVAWDDDTLERRQEVIADTRSVDFWLYDFTYQPLIDLFKKMARGGVKIRGIMENELYGNNGKNFQKLQKTFTGKYSIAIHSDELLRDNFMHAKTFLTDKAFIIQTANLGYPSFFRNREFFFISHDVLILENLRVIFAKDRAGQKLLPEDIHPNLLICPIDCRHKITTLLSGAKRSIIAYEQYIVDPAILALLTGKQQAAVDIKLIV